MADEIFRCIEISQLEGRARSTRLRQHQFHDLWTALRRSEKAIKNAIVADDGSDAWEATLEYGLTLAEVKAHYDSFSLASDLKSAYAVENLDATTTTSVTYIIPAHRNLFYSVLSPLSAALAAGTCVIVEASLPPTLLQVTSVLRDILPTALDSDIFTISNERPAKDFLSRCNIVAQAEEADFEGREGGITLLSSPSATTVAVVDRTADTVEAARAIGKSKRSFGGQSHYAPDIVLVNDFVADEFITSLVRDVLASKPKIDALPTNSPSRLELEAQKSLKEVEARSGLRVIVSGPGGSIVDIVDRSEISFEKKAGSRIIFIYRISSLDDAIDLCNRSGKPLDASYVFASASEANYVSRFLDARITCVGHIPLELLVGPSAPDHVSIAPCPSPRYSPAMFTVPRPRLSTRSRLTASFQGAGTFISASELDRWSRSILDRSLPSMQQGDGKVVGFFDQALMVFGSGVLTVMLGGAFLLVRRAKAT